MSKSWISLDLEVQFNGVDMRVNRVFEMSVFEEFGTCIRVADSDYIQVFIIVNGKD